MLPNDVTLVYERPTKRFYDTRKGLVCVSESSPPYDDETLLFPAKRNKKGEYIFDTGVELAGVWHVVSSDEDLLNEYLSKPNKRPAKANLAKV
jgi:hypothetical protein